MRKLAWQRGFSLIEAMVALLVITIGLLGVAGLQALAISNTHRASLRSIAAIEASNMASYIDANPQFWANNPPSSVTVVPLGSSVTFLGAGAGLMILPTSCTATAQQPCQPDQMAAWDMYNWGAALGKQLPAGQGGVQCGNGLAPSTSVPLTCVVTVQWQENSLALNAQSGGSSSAPLPGTQTENYSLVVQP